VTSARTDFAPFSLSTAAAFTRVPDSPAELVSQWRPASERNYRKYPPYHLKFVSTVFLHKYF